MAGLSHHVCKAVLFHRIQQQFGLLDRSPRCGDGGYHVLAVFHRLDGVLHVKWAIGKNSDSVDVFGEHKFFERIVCFGAIIDLHESLAPVLAQVTDCPDLAVRMFVPLKRSAESSSDDADTNLLRSGIDCDRALRNRHGSRKGQTTVL